MAQLSALFALLALLAYVHGRLALERGNRRAGWAALFIATPLCVLAGVLSKENAVVAIGLCVAAELTLLRVSARSRTSVLSFHGLFLAMPVCAALALLWFWPERLVGGYDAREFTLAERLLSQPRALLDYLGLIVVPQGPRMGLYTDDFVASTGWLTPPSTAIAALIVAGLLVGALVLRRRFPIVAFGVLFFFAGHAIESTFLPLELYFEHRNYLPMIGIVIAVIGSFGYLAAARSPLTTRGLGLPGIAALLFLGVLAVATTGRVLVWGSAEAIAEQGVRSNPESLRAHTDLATLLERRGEHAKATATMLKLAASERPKNRAFGLLGAASTQCAGGLAPDPTLLDRAVDALAVPVSSSLAHIVTMLSITVSTHTCPPLTMALVALTAERLAAKATAQPLSSPPIWLLNYEAARLYAQSGDLAAAVRAAQRAWQPTADPPVGELLVRLYLQTGRLDDAQSLLRAVRARTPATEVEGTLILDAHQDLIDRLDVQTPATDAETPQRP